MQTAIEATQHVEANVQTTPSVAVNCTQTHRRPLITMLYVPQVLMLYTF